LSRDFAIYEFDLKESVALSTSDPMECTPWAWKNRTHLESVGASCISFGSNRHFGNRHFGHTSSHGGGKLSTVIYKKRPIVMCQIDDFKGIFICYKTEVPNFSKGLNKLIEEKMDPESRLNKELNGLRLELRKEVDKYPNQDSLEIKWIKKSGILEDIDAETLEKIKGKENPSVWLSNKNLENFIKLFYDGYLGKITHTGIALYHLKLPTDHLVKESQQEHLEFYRVALGSLIDPKKEMLSIKISLNSSKIIFS